jgi:hypothetical protein
MEPVKQMPEDKYIKTSDIRWDHVCVAIINDRPTILGKGYNEDSSELTFRFIGGSIGTSSTGTNGNGFDFGPNNNTPQLMVEHALYLGYKVAVFEHNQWREALQWLMDNTKTH